MSTTTRSGHRISYGWHGNPILIGGRKREIGIMKIYVTSPAILALVLTLQVAVTYASEPGQTIADQEGSPVILFDRGHNNYRYDESDQVFDQFLLRHGFIVRYHRARINEGILEGVDVFHTSNALAPENVDNWSLPTPSAFTPDEIKVLVDWVRNGGSLLLAIEHMPFGGSYDELAIALGIKVSNGFAVNRLLLHDYSPESVSAAGYLLFVRDNESMAAHPVINGQVPYGQIKHLATDTGSAFLLPAKSTSFITLGSDVISLEPEKSWVFSDETPRLSVAGWSQAGIMEIGDGRVAVLGDNFLVTAPEYLEPPFIEDETEAESGAHNHQFTLNLYRWLSRQEAQPLSD
jgi:hypothetical protein